MAHLRTGKIGLKAFPWQQPLPGVASPKCQHGTEQETLEHLALSPLSSPKIQLRTVSAETSITDTGTLWASRLKQTQLRYWRLSSRGHGGWWSQRLHQGHGRIANIKATGPTRRATMNARENQVNSVMQRKSSLGHNQTKDVTIPLGESLGMQPQEHLTLYGSAAYRASTS